jgi:phosphatidylserine/phosphatidylglycerophosphate/cardiolipin synthase-like enzyme
MKIDFTDAKNNLFLNPRVSVSVESIALHSLSYPWALSRAVQETESRIYISAYILSASPGKTSDPVMNLLEQIVYKKMEKGIDVKILLHNHHIKVGVGRSLATLLFWLSNNKVPVRVAVTNYPVHRKMILMDDKSLFIGSHNLSTTSLLNPNELSVEIRSPVYVNLVAGMFEEYWKTLFSYPVQEGMTWLK